MKNKITHKTKALMTAIIDHLAGKRLTLNQICEYVKLSKPNTSQYLLHLEKLHLVNSSRVQDAKTCWISQAFDKDVFNEKIFVDDWKEVFAEHLQDVEDEKNSNGYITRRGNVTIVKMRHTYTPLKPMKYGVSAHATAMMING